MSGSLARNLLLMCLVASGSAADLSPFKWLLAQASYGSPLQLLTGTSFQRKLGDLCDRSVDCLQVANSVCVDGRCLCQKGFFPALEEDRRDPGSVCKLALNYRDTCKSSEERQQCREPFVCSPDDICDCPSGFVIADGGTKCIRNCKPNHVLVRSKAATNHSEICLPLLELGEECSHNEQCSSRYAQCLVGRCQCIAGTLRRGRQCVTVKQCPLGEAPLENGYPLICDRRTLKCPEGNYCLFAQFTDARGFCCPTMKVNCPVGSPLSYGCANCPWETHHCFTYSIGSHQQSMCCPNDCPRNLPIRHGDKCYAIVGHGAHCSVDEQCLSVQNSVCTGPSNETRTCQCPGNHMLVDGTCQRVSKLGGECESSTDCFVGSNTVCRSGYCRCSEGFIPEPTPLDWDDTKGAFAVEHCIAEPSCPSVGGLVAIEQYEHCSPKAECSDGKFCRRWYTDAAKERTYSLCCPIPSVREYEEICAKFGMKMLLANGLDSRQAQPFRCLLPTHGGVAGAKPLHHPATAAAIASAAAAASTCPTDAACVFNPFARHEGVCCRYEKRVAEGKGSGLLYSDHPFRFPF